MQITSVTSNSDNNDEESESKTENQSNNADDSSIITNNKIKTKTMNKNKLTRHKLVKPNAYHNDDKT